MADPGHPSDPVPNLRIKLLGPLEVVVAGQRLPRLRSRKGLWLLALLVLRSERDVDRDWLAGTLWPETDESHARRSLRQSLHDLRAALGSESHRIRCDEPRTLRLDLRDAFVDVLAFDAALSRGDPDSLDEAVGLYGGAFLEDCAEEWCIENRRRFEQAYLKALETLAAEASKLHQYSECVRFLQLATAADPYRDDIQRNLMEAHDLAGNPTAALMTYREYRALLAREMALAPADETTNLFRRIRDSSRVGSVPVAESKRVAGRIQREELRFMLPIPLTPLIGREQDVQRAVSILNEVRLFTLTGTGGVGKTRLAIEVAAAAGGSYSEGAVFVDLSALENSDHLLDAVRSAVGARTSEKPLDALAELCRYLAGRQLLLVLDNCEHLGHACGRLAAELLSRCANLKILATSRQVLGIRGETVWRVPSLAVPGVRSGKRISLGELHRVSAFLDFAAIRLFAERANAAESTFAISPKNAVAVATICSRLDGIPLAIELAAARVKAMPVERIAARLIDRFRILLGEGRSLAVSQIPRHQTLQASIGWSYELLSEREQALLQRVAIFVGGWSLDAAEAVCSGGPVREWEVLDLLSGLVEKSLVVYLPNEDRYRLLETIRQYLLESHKAPEPRNGVAAKHLKYFVTFAEAIEPELKGPRQAACLDRLEEDHDNVRAALNWSRSVSGDSELGLRLTGAMFRFWQVRGYVTEGREHVKYALACSTKATLARAKVLNVGGILAYRQSDFHAARSLYEEALAIRRKLEDLTGIASSLCNLGVITLEQGDTESARTLYEEGLAISRQLDNQWGIALCLHHLGTVAHEQEKFAAARERYEESLIINRAIGDRAGIAYSLCMLGRTLYHLQDPDAARNLHEECLSIRRSLGDRLGIAQSLHDLGRSIAELGMNDKALRLLIESLEIRHELCDRIGIAEVFETLAHLSCVIDDCADSAESASRLYGAAEALREEIGAQMSRGVQEEHKQRVARVRKLLNSDRFERAWAEGREMPLNRVVAIALNTAGSGGSAAVYGEDEGRGGHPIPPYGRTK